MKSYLQSYITAHRQPHLTITQATEADFPPDDVAATALDQAWESSNPPIKSRGDINHMGCWQGLAVTLRFQVV